MGSFGMKTKVQGGTKAILRRLAVMRRHRFELGNWMIKSIHSSWFRKGWRGRTEEDDLGVFKFAHKNPPKFDFDAEAIVNRFAGRGVWEEWSRDGTTVARGAMSWLFEDSKVIQMIDEEVKMYLYHRRKVNGQPNLGWLRSAYFSQIQQLVRQDPVYYALVAATNPERNWRQISFPYYMKAVLPGDYIFFQHLDINVKRYLECGRGKNRIQTSLTLTQENEEECTYVVPGFHSKIAKWWRDLNTRHEGSHTPAGQKIQDHNGNCLKTSDIYTAQDQKKYGAPVPVVCSPGDIRISRPEILHGSGSSKMNGVAKTKRIVVNPWFVGIQEDHSTLDIPESGSWELYSACHRDHKATRNTPSGQFNVHGLPPFRFPASVALRDISALSDALVGLRRWDDPLVMRERDVLLGEDEAASWAFVHRVRERAIQLYKGNVRLARELEEEAYGGNSYYRQKRKGKSVDVQYEVKRAEFEESEAEESEQSSAEESEQSSVEESEKSSEEESEQSSAEESE